MEKLPSFSWCFDRRGTLATTGVASVEMRVSYMRRCKVMATGVRLGRGEWRDGRVVKRGDAVALNRVLERMRGDVLRVLDEMMEEGMVDIMAIPDRMARMKGDGRTFLEWCRERAEVRKYGRAADSQERYDRFLRWFSAWGGIRYFSDVTDHGVLAMDAALKERGMTDYSKWNNYHRFLNSFIIDAMDAGLLRRNPYKWVNIRKDKESHGLHKYLTLEELRWVETARMGTESLERVRDLFVFQCYTCLAYHDLAAFDAGRLVDVGGGRWSYSGERGKTGKEYSFLLLRPAVAVLEKYGWRLPVLSNVKYNEYLKVVAQTAGVDKPITSHWARHTGATVLLNAGVDMETVARVLGHSSTKVTRSTYARLLDDTVVRKMLEAEREIGIKKDGKA